jgi:glycerol-3-phosphate O-acyltransferase
MTDTPTTPIIPKKQPLTPPTLIFITGISLLIIGAVINEGGIIFIRRDFQFIGSTMLYFGMFFAFLGILSDRFWGVTTK